MFKHILVALDGSSASEKAIEKGLQLAQVTGARVLALTATEIWSAMAVSGPDGRKRIEKFELAQERAAKAILAAFEARAKVMGVAPVLLHVPDQDAARAITNAAEKEGCDLIVMGSHGRRGLDRLLLGSQAQRVLTDARCPVLICR